jgi:hypothetical protein
VTLADTAANTLTGSLGRQSGEGVGNYALTNGSLALASSSASSNYQLTINTTGANRTITQASLTATAQNASKTYGTDDPTLGYHRRPGERHGAEPGCERQPGQRDARRHGGQHVDR